MVHHAFGNAFAFRRSRTSSRSDLSSRNRECLHQSLCGSKGMRLKGGAQVKEEEVSVGKAVVSEEMERGVA